MRSKPQIFILSRNFNVFVDCAQMIPTVGGNHDYHAGSHMPKLTKRTIDATGPQATEFFLWDEGIPSAAAIDIGSTMHMAAVNPDSTGTPIRAFGTFTHDLHDLARWFKSCGVTSVAMETTGVNWIPAFEILEQHRLEVILVNARYARNVPGRKTDVSDAGWLRQLHSYGQLWGSFRPEAEVATLRAWALFSAGATRRVA